MPCCWIHLQWNSVDAMNSLSSLRKLRFKNNPILNGTSKFFVWKSPSDCIGVLTSFPCPAEGQLASRQLVIARLSGITDLNLSRVSCGVRQMGGV